MVGSDTELPCKFCMYSQRSLKKFTVQTGKYSGLQFIQGVKRNSENRSNSSASASLLPLCQTWVVNFICSQSVVKAAILTHFPSTLASFLQTYLVQCTAVHDTCDCTVQHVHLSTALMPCCAGMDCMASL